MEIDIQKVITEALTHMENENDVRWSVGMALQELYWDEFMREVQTELTAKYNQGN
jgi:hypothetical protein